MPGDYTTIPLFTASLTTEEVFFFSAIILAGEMLFLIIDEIFLFPGLFYFSFYPF